MNMKLLQRILPLPPEPQEVKQTDDWHRVESELGTPLPKDYKAFISAYGSGRIDQFLVVFNPFSSNKYVNLLDAGRTILQAYATSKETFPEYYPLPLFPSPGGLLPFAATDNGNVLYWRTTGKPENWTVAAYESRGPDYVDFNGQMTDFHGRDNVTRSFVCEVITSSFPDEPPVFYPVVPKS